MSQVYRVDSMPAASRKRTNIFIGHSLAWSVLVTSIEILDASALEARSNQTFPLQIGNPAESPKGGMMNLRDLRGD